MFMSNIKEIDAPELSGFIAEWFHLGGTDKGHCLFHSEVVFVIAGDKKNRGSEAV